jgi:hypothetical protein
MLNATVEKVLSNILMAGTALISIFVVSGTVTDPVNVTKLLVLGGVAGAAGAIALCLRFTQIWQSNKLTLIFVFIFILTVLNSVIQSDAPTTQLIYGAYGRNAGFLTYFLLAMLLVSTLALTKKSSFTKINYGLIAAGVVNVIYSFWVIAFGDFIGWSNPYGNILGTFGNPNFVGAFLGIFASLIFAYMVKPDLKIIYRIGLGLLLVVTFYEIASSNAIQGIVVSAGGISIVGFYFLRAKFKSLILICGYSALVVFGGIISLLGALQIGPLTSWVYKNSVSLRGEYWQAGWNMAAQFPWSGVGMDTYGDWYRRLRDDNALINPGPNTISNAAHNVVLDQLSYGGWPMFIAYLLIIFLVIISIIKVISRTREYDITFVGLSIAWICYQVQSIISINQIGLAIWGWVLGGALIAYERSTRVNSDNEPVKVSRGRNSKVNRQSGLISPQMVGAVGAVVGLLIAVPPYSSDAKWKTALASGNVQEIEKALVPAYLNPQNSFRYANAAQLLEVNKLNDLSYKYAKIGVEFNPDFFDAWKMLYYVQKATPEDKALAKLNLERLDPMNKNIFDVPTE